MKCAFFERKCSRYFFFFGNDKSFFFLCGLSFVCEGSVIPNSGRYGLLSVPLACLVLALSVHDALPTSQR